MSFEEACELFYNNEEIQKNFDFWEIDYLLSQVNIFLSDIEHLQKGE